MKKIVCMGVFALSGLLATEQQASAWHNFKFGAGFNFSYASGGTHGFYFGTFHSGEPPAAACWGEPYSVFPSFNHAWPVVTQPVVASQPTSAESIAAPVAQPTGYYQQVNYPQFSAQQNATFGGVPFTAPYTTGYWYGYAPSYWYGH